MKNLFQLLSLTLISILLFSCQPETTDIDLTANRWKLVKFKESNAASFQKAKADYFLEFVSDSIYSLSLDVNTCGGYYISPEKGTIDIEENMYCTKVCCDTDYAEAFSQAFLQATQYYGQGEEVIFEGEGKLVFVQE